MSDPTHQLSQVLDTLLQQEYEGFAQDANSLNALLNNVLPAYFKKTLNEAEKSNLLKIFQCIRLLTGRSPSLVIESDRYKRILQCIKYFYDSRYHDKVLSDTANFTLIQILTGCFGGKLRNNKYIFEIRDDLLDTLDENLKFILESITNSSGTGSFKSIDLRSVTETNDSKFSKLSISIRIMEVLLETSLADLFMLQYQGTFLVENLLNRIWFCMDNYMMNSDLYDETGSNENILSQTSIKHISRKFDELYSILLVSICNNCFKSDYPQVNHIESVLLRCRQLLNWSLLNKFPLVQLSLAETLMKMFILCKNIDNLSYFWNKSGISSDKLALSMELINKVMYKDLNIVLSLLLVIDFNMTYDKSKPLDEQNSISYRQSLITSLSPFTNKRLEPLRRRLLFAACESDEYPDIDTILTLTDQENLIYLVDKSDRYELLKAKFSSFIDDINNDNNNCASNTGLPITTSQLVIDLTIDLTVEKEKPVQLRTNAKLFTWIRNLSKLVKEKDTINPIVTSSVGKLYIIKSLGNFACLLAGDYDFEAKMCKRCEYGPDEHTYLVNTVSKERDPISKYPEMETAFEILLTFISDPNIMDNCFNNIACLISLKKIFCSYRPPPLSKSPKLWKFIQACFTSTVREIRLLSTKVIPLLLLAPDDEQFEEDFHTVLEFVCSFKTTEKSDSYVFEGIITSWGEMAMVTGLEDRLYVMLNALIQFLGESDEFRSNLALHELKIVAFARGITPWMLIEPFIPLISYDVIKRRKRHPWLLAKFCDLIKMPLQHFLIRTQEFTIPRFVGFMTEDHIGFITDNIGEDRTVTIDKHMAKILAVLLTADDKIDANKIMKIIAISNPRYKGMKLETIIRDVSLLSLVWELAILNNSEQMKKRIIEAFTYACGTRQLDNSWMKRKQSFIKKEMDLMILGLAQAFSGITHDHRGSKPYLVKVNAIRGIRCIIEMSNSFESCLSQIMTCLQIALESEELQKEGLECLHVLVSNLNYSPLSIIVDLLISYLIQKYKSFNTKCKSLTNDILVTIFQADPKIVKEHPSYVYSLSLISDFENITNKYDIKNHNILLEFDRRLKDENKWVILQVLDDFHYFLKTHQIDFQRAYIHEKRLKPIFASLLSNIMSTSNKFSIKSSDIPRKCADVLSCMGAIDVSKIESFFHQDQKKIVLVSNLVNDKETAEFSCHFLNNILVKAFVASTDPQKQLFLAYSMQEYLKMLDLTPENIVNSDTAEYIIWRRLSKLSQTVLKPLLISKYTKSHHGHPSLKYPLYKNTKKHSIWLKEFTGDLLSRSSAMKKLPKTARLLFSNCSIVIQGQDLTISEFLIPYVALMLVVYGDDQINSDFEIEINTVLNEDLEALSNDSAIESLKSCYRTVFSIIDYFREWVSERKKDKKYVSPTHLQERKRVESFLSMLPTDLLAKRTAQCNSYERAIFNLEQSYLTDKMNKDEFFSTIRHMYAEIDDTDALQGVLKKFSTDSLNDKLLQFQYSDDWRVTHESLGALTELDYGDDINGPTKKLDSITSLLKCLDDHCEYDQVLLKLRNFESSIFLNEEQNLYESQDSKDWVCSGLQAAIFTGQIDELQKWARHAERYTSISSPGSEMSIYYEFARALITLNANKMDHCLTHISNASSYVGMAFSVSKEISHTKVSNYMTLLHCLYDFETLSTLKDEKVVRPLLSLLQTRANNTTKDFKVNWKIHSMRKSIEKLHPSSALQLHLGESMVQSSKILRESGKLDLATKNITGALMMTDATSKQDIDLELSKLLWAQGDHSQALKLLKSLIDDPATKKSPDIQLTYTEWLQDSANGSSDEVIKGYEAASALDTYSGKPQYYLGRYYNKMLDAQSVETSGLKKPEKDFYGNLEFNVIKAYTRSAALSNNYLFEVLPKAVTIWLDYSAKYRSASELSGYSYEIISSKRRDNYSSILKLIKLGFSKSEIPVHRWYTVLSQLISRMVHGDPETESLILKIITDLARNYPEVVLYSVYSQVQSNSTDRAKRGKKICEVLQSSTDVTLSQQVFAAFQLLEALNGVCQVDIRRSRHNRLHLYNDLKFSYPADVECRALAIPLTANFQKLLSSGNSGSHRKSSAFQVEKFVTFKAFDSRVSILSSMQKPRRLYIVGSDSKKYSIMCKPNDDLRKDAKLMEFTTVMDRLLRNNSEAEKRNLSILSYAVIPLNETMGVIEMVDNVRTIRDIMLNYLQRQGVVMDFSRLKDLLGDSYSTEKKIVNYKKLLNEYKPVLQIWFEDQFANPVTWYQSRNNYTRSCAVMSIVGYLVGMGDRHGDNIMLNENTGQILHVDFDCLFDKGKKLAVPERVPFRLTQNMTTAMGVNGYEGSYRKTCEVTMKLIRENENILMNVLETFLYDPIMDWKVKKKRRGGEDLDAGSSGGLQPQAAMETIRRKIKGILDRKDLDTGAKDSGGLAVSVGAQVDAVIQQATSDENLAQMYVGWMSFL
ncbi:hypothetical protein CANARDRAFT_194713 [[Candida] arabinofermentans NRRL YB-2248]|uniref:Serine/threonine-protein kinase MEC1 n=1 Tax=[Candida] arabinofermentans NRRL YB-2248 TaxID=983967 RepID=A0A1E4T779_9ASCO|nr:hypothetical protein CANARDRAFT_194713 [[Candida] arabinofermentans NRRL YB-2248]